MDFFSRILLFSMLGFILGNILVIKIDVEEIKDNVLSSDNSSCSLNYLEN